MNNLFFVLTQALVTISSIPFVDSYSIDKRSPSTEGVIIGPDTPVDYLEYPHDGYLKVVRDVNKFEASPSYNYYRIPENKSNGTFILKILVVLDWHLVGNRAEQDILNEVLTKWNEADKHFEQLDNPKIKLAIAGVVIPTKSDTWNTMIFNQKIRSIEGLQDRYLCDLYISLYGIPYYPNFMAKWLNDNAGLFESFEYDVFMFMTRRRFGEIWDSVYAHNSYMTHNKFACDAKNAPNFSSSGGFVKNNMSFGSQAAKTVAFILGIFDKSGKDCVQDMITNRRSDEYFWSECSKSAFRSMINNSKYTCLHQIPHDQDDNDYS